MGYEVRAVPCDACEATGKTLEFRRDHDGSDYLRPSDEPCFYCDGTGLMIVEVEPIEMEELPL